MSDNMTKIIVSIVGGIVALTIEYWRIFRRAPVDHPDTEKPKPAKQKSKADPKPTQEGSRREPAPNDFTQRTTDLRRGIFIGLIVAVLIWVLLSLLFQPPNEIPLWTFDQGTEAWQPEKQSAAKPAAAAIGVSWNAAGTLQGEFNFALVKPETLSGDMEPRATYYIDPVQARDWSDFQTLTFEVDNRSTHDLEVIFTISNITNGRSCWYEFGESQPIPQGQKSSLRFDLTDHSYKTCDASGGYNQPPATFDQVWRFDIIFGTPEFPWNEVQGFVLIDNIKLTDRVR